MTNQSNVWWKVLRIFTITMILLTFFSKTFYHLSLPIVEVEKAFDDALKVESYATVLTVASKSEAIRAQVSASVKEVLVRDGDFVKEGDVLIILDDRQYYEEKAALQISRKAIAQQLNLLNDQLSDMNGNDYSDEIQATQTLYDSGVIAKAEYKAKMASYTQSKQASNSLLSSIASYKSELESLDYRLKSLDDKLEVCSVKAPKDMKIQDLSVAAGDYVSANQALLKLQSSDEGMSVSIEMATDYSRYLQMGDKAQVNRMNSYDSQDCVLVKRESSSNRSGAEVLTFEITEGIFAPAEKLQFKLTKRVGSGPLVPKSALGQKIGEKQQIFTVSEEDGVFGRRHVVKPMMITVTHTGTGYVLVEEAITSGTPIVSNKFGSVLEAGDHVYVQNK